MKLYLTNKFFNKKLYAECLKEIGVNAEVVENGVMINIEQYKVSYKGQNRILYMNHDFIKQLY